MGPLGISPPRLRVALIAVITALAATALASPGVASGANQTVSLNCLPATVDAGEKTNCLGIVSSKGGAPAPVGPLHIFVTGWTGFVDLGPGFCELQPVSATASVCSLPITGYVGGEENVVAQYFDPAVPPPNEEPAADNFELTIRGGEVRVFCSEPLIVQGEQTLCQAFIPTADGASPPTGTVDFTTITDLGFHAGSIDSQCLLEPTSGGARCFVTFVSAGPSVTAVAAEYSGDGTYPADDGSTIVEVAEQHQTSVITRCDNTEPVVFTVIECFTTVTNDSPTGGAPIGTVRLEAETSESGVFPGPNGPLCTLDPIGEEEKTATCSALYRPRLLGQQTLEGAYAGHAVFALGRDSVVLDVRKGRLTSTTLACQQVSIGVFGKCTATVADTEANPVRPTGFVAFRTSPPGVELSSKTCQLTPGPLAGSAQCGINYRSHQKGNVTLTADYQGASTTHQPSQGSATVFVQGVFQIP